MNPFLNGAVCTLCVIAALFFFRFWRLTRDRLFVFFSGAFLVLAVHWAGLGLLIEPLDVRHYLYVPRLIAFLLIIAGIIDKNRGERRADHNAQTQRRDR